MKQRTVPSLAKHEAFYQDVATLMKKHLSLLTPMEILAVLSNAVGKVVAMQDQRTTTPAMAMECVARNIEAGNEEALAELRGPAASRA